MDAINKFTSINPAISSLQQEEQLQPEETSSQFSNTGVASAADAFETFQQPTFDLTPATLEAPPQPDTVDASAVFDLIATDIKNANLPTPDLNGLTIPIDAAGINFHSLASVEVAPGITNDFAKKAAETAAVLNRISQFTGKSIEELQSIFKKYSLKPGELPYPPDEKIIALLKDPAFSNQNEVKLLWEIYNGFEDVRPPERAKPNFSESQIVSPRLDALIPAIENIRNAAIARELYKKVSEFTGKSPEDIQELFKHYHLKPTSLPNPPDYNVYQFLQDPAFVGISPALLLYEIYGW